MIEFLNEIKERMEDNDGKTGGIQFDMMINILVIHAQSEHVTLQVGLCPHLDKGRIEPAAYLESIMSRVNAHIGTNVRLNPT